MSVAIITITDTSTYETKEVRQTIHGEIEPYLFNWQEGNYSCDCNRGLFFDGNEHPCGDGRYLVKIQIERLDTFYDETVD